MQLDFPFSMARLDALRQGAVMVPDAPAVLRVEGSGAISCLQGLLTQDLEAAGPESMVYGALLTSKGMIVADLWVLRDAAGARLLLEGSMRAPVLALLARSLPPRLARVTDQTDEWRAVWFLGSGSRERIARGLGTSVPATGRAIPAGDTGLILAAGPPAAPFALLLCGPAPILEAQQARLAAGFATGDHSDLAAARVLAGWPRLGHEIDERTLPQEVRFEENGGVSYTKGCYTGQETVARVHFRGHVNRTLRGLVLEGEEAPSERAVRSGEKEVGRLGTALTLPGRTIGLAVIRREVLTGSTVAVGPRSARVVELPIRVEELRL
jgi:folate-binding protein YgfZ